MLAVRGLIKRYNRIPAVDGVSFTIRPGEILGYVGPNGAGKSTTVKVLTGLIDPTDGEIFFNGRDVREDWIGFQRRMGYVPEEPHLYPHLAGREYLQLAGRLRGIPRVTLERKMDELLRLVGLWDDRHAPLASYSKGMRQRILLISALMHDPEVVILDEPFSGLDVISALLLRKVIGLLAAQGKAIFFCSHVLEVVDKVCSHLLILRRGSVVAHGSIEEIRSGTFLPALEDTFLHLTEQVDADKVAGNILAAINA